ncbi:hypothetical protein M9434_004127 [Picochlorum sp. BPE23]|nr:hypothetical protein M9434_004127 [Picochlorum sp. BPE23]
MTKNVCADLLLSSNTRRQRGNALFRQGQYEMALEVYQDIVNDMDAFFRDNAVAENGIMDSQDHVELMIAKVPVELNISACYSKLERHEDTIRISTQVLSYNTMFIRRLQHAKMYYRRAQAFAAQKKYMDAFADFDKAMLVAAEDQTIRDASKKVTREWAERVKESGCVGDAERAEYEYYCAKGLRPGEDRYRKDAPYTTVLPGMGEALRKSGAFNY